MELDQITVSLFRKPGSNIYHMQYRCPETGNKRRRSTKTHIKRDAERIAGRWEKEVREGRDQSNGRIAWDVFRERFEQRHLPTLRPKSQEKYIGVLNSIEGFRKPRQLRVITTEYLSQYQQHLRDQGRADATIKGNLVHIRAALSWAVDNGYLSSVPKAPKIKRAKAQRLMKGRPLLLEEFERMLGATEKVILKPNTSMSKKEREPDHDRIPHWKFLLQGLWLSGFRLAEAMDFHWTDTERIRVDMSGERPMIRIPATKEKGGTDRVLPATPDFAELLSSVPRQDRHGFVFNPLPQNEGAPRMQANAVGRKLSAIGRKAGIIVRVKNGEPQYATAHDLRRSFGTRWSTKVMPVMLQQMMRHQDITTTMRYYVVADAEQMAEELWSMHLPGSVLGSDQYSGAGDATANAKN